MKTKNVNKQRKQARKSLSIEDELKGEFGDVYSEDIIDEEAMCVVLMEEDE